MFIFKSQEIPSRQFLSWTCRIIRVIEKAEITGNVRGEPVILLPVRIVIRAHYNKLGMQLMVILVVINFILTVNQRFELKNENVQVIQFEQMF